MFADVADPEDSLKQLYKNTNKVKRDDFIELF